MEVEDASLQPVVQSSSAVNHAQQQQAILFSPKFSFNNFILLEVDEKLADELLYSNSSGYVTATCKYMYILTPFFMSVYTFVGGKQTRLSCALNRQQMPVAKLKFPTRF